jgi:hypothetical protein
VQLSTTSLAGRNEGFHDLASVDKSPHLDPELFSPELINFESLFNLFLDCDFLTLKYDL